MSDSCESPDVKETTKWNNKILFHLSEDHMIGTIEKERVYDLISVLPGWSYKCHNLEETREMISSKYPTYIEFYMSLPSDELRKIMGIYLWLYEHGGFYISNQYQPDGEVETLKKDTFDINLLYFSMINYGYGYHTRKINKDIIGSTPRHQFWLDATNEFINQYRINKSFIIEDPHVAGNHRLFSELMMSLLSGGYNYTIISMKNVDVNSKELSNSHIKKKVTRSVYSKILLVIVVIMVLLSISVCVMAWIYESRKVNALSNK